ncbi:hypothetical protein FB451DRAFT_1371448 [Mycena latifolia]|nr:hypothetical protein FB451DRAFT_1371448 [Mycena latifolia]
MSGHRPSSYAAYRTDPESAISGADTLSDGNSDHPAPAFPPELERQLFEICALSRPVFIPTLMLVAWRVKEWVEPLLYRTVALDLTAPMDGFPVFTSEILLAAIERKPASFFGDALRNFLLPSGTPTSIETLQAIFPVCTGVQNLWIESLDAEMIHLFTPLVLNRLYVGEDPFQTLPPVHPFFSQITHFEIFEIVYWPDDTPVWTALAFLPRLTHFSFGADDESFISISLRLLETCESLSVLVVIMDASPSVEESASLSKDFRFVAMPLMFYAKDWQMGVHSGNDYWSRAETFIAKRRSGEIDASEYRIFEDASQHILPLDLYHEYQ